MARKLNTETDDGSVSLFGGENEPSERTAGNDGTDDERNNSGEFVDPKDAIGSEYERDEHGNPVIGANGKPRKKRGRKPGGKTARRNQQKSSGNSEAVNALTQALLLVHMGLAGLTKFPDFALDNDEAKALANSVSNVLAEFDVEPNPKFVALIGLASTASIVYGPRVYLYKQQKSKKKDNKKEVKESGDNVIDMSPLNLGG